MPDVTSAFMPGKKRMMPMSSSGLICSKTRVSVGFGRRSSSTMSISTSMLPIGGKLGDSKAASSVEFAFVARFPRSRTWAKRRVTSGMRAA